MALILYGLWLAALAGVVMLAIMGVVGFLGGLVEVFKGTYRR